MPSTYFDVADGQTPTLVAARTGLRVVVETGEVARVGGAGTAFFIFNDVTANLAGFAFAAGNASKVIPDCRDGAFWSRPGDGLLVQAISGNFAGFIKWRYEV